MASASRAKEGCDAAMAQGQKATRARLPPSRLSSLPRLDKLVAGARGVAEFREAGHAFASSDEIQSAGAAGGSVELAFLSYSFWKRPEPNNVLQVVRLKLDLT